MNNPSNIKFANFVVEPSMYFFCGRLPEDGDLSVKHVGELMFMGDNS